MVRSLIADYRAASVYSVSPSKLSELGFTTIFLDLDNTLAPYDVPKPEKRTYDYIEGLKKEGLEVILVSNNRAKRVKVFASYLDVSYIASAHKPFAYKIVRYMKDRGIQKKKTLLAGDQVINDMRMARKAGIKGLLTEPISAHDHITAKAIRPLDRALRKKYRKQGRLGMSLD